MHVSLAISVLGKIVHVRSLLSQALIVYHSEIKKRKVKMISDFIDNAGL